LVELKLRLNNNQQAGETGRLEAQKIV